MVGGDHSFDMGLVINYSGGWSPHLFQHRRSINGQLRPFMSLLIFLQQDYVSSSNPQEHILALNQIVTVS